MIYEFNNVKYDVNTNNDYLSLYSVPESINAGGKIVFFSKDEKIGYADKLLYQIKLEATKHYNTDKYKYNNIIYIQLTETYKDAEGNEYEIKKNINLGAYIEDKTINHISDGGVGSLISVTGEIVNNNLSTITVKDFHLYVADLNVKKNDETSNFEVPVFYGTGVCHYKSTPYHDYGMYFIEACYIEQAKISLTNRDNTFIGVYINKIVNEEGANILKVVYPDIYIEYKNKLPYELEYNDLFVYNDRLELIGIINKDKNLVVDTFTEYLVILKYELQMINDKYFVFNDKYNFDYNNFCIVIFVHDLVNMYQFKSANINGAYIDENTKHDIQTSNYYNRIFKTSETSYSYADKLNNALRLWSGDTNYGESSLGNYNNNYSVKSSIVYILISLGTGNVPIRVICSVFPLNRGSFSDKYKIAQISDSFDIVKYKEWPYYFYRLSVLGDVNNSIDEIEGIDKIGINISSTDYYRIAGLEYSAFNEYTRYIINSGTIDKITNQLINNQYNYWKGPNSRIL